MTMTTSRDAQTERMGLNSRLASQCLLQAAGQCVMIHSGFGSDVNDFNRLYCFTTSSVTLVLRSRWSVACSDCSHDLARHGQSGWQTRAGTRPAAAARFDSSADAGKFSQRSGHAVRNRQTLSSTRSLQSQLQQACTPANIPASLASAIVTASLAHLQAAAVAANFAGRGAASSSESQGTTSPASSPNTSSSIDQVLRSGRAACSLLDVNKT